MAYKIIPFLYLSLVSVVLQNEVIAFNVIEGSRSSTPIALAAETFTDLLLNGKMFVDKSLLIKHVIDTLDIPFKLITRPNGWGKSVNMNMIRIFFELEMEEDSDQTVPREETVGYKLFQNGEIFDHEGHVVKFRWPLLISNYEDLLETYQGQYPVIYLSLGDLKPKSYKEFEKEAARRIREAFHKYNYRRLCSTLHAMREPVDKTLLIKLHEMMDEKSSLIWGNFMYMCELLEMYFKKKPFILIDDYDEPLLQVLHQPVVGKGGIVEKMMDSYHALFTELKNADYHSSAILAGTTRLTFNRFTQPKIPPKIWGHTDEETVTKKLDGSGDEYGGSELDSFYDSDDSDSSSFSDDDSGSHFTTKKAHGKNKPKGKQIRTPKSFTMKNKKKVMTTNTPKYTLIDNKEDEARFLKSFSDWVVGTTADIFAKSEVNKRNDYIHQYYGLNDDEVELIFKHVDLSLDLRKEAIANYGGYEYHERGNMSAPSTIAKFLANRELKNYFPQNTTADTLVISCLRNRYFHRLIHRYFDGLEWIRPAEVGNPFLVFENDVVDFAKYLDKEEGVVDMGGSDIALCFAAGYFTERWFSRTAFRGDPIYRVKIPNKQMMETMKDKMMQFHASQCGLTNGIGPILEQLHNLTENLRVVLFAPEGDAGETSMLAASVAEFLPLLPCFGGDSLMITQQTMYHVYYALCLVALDMPGFKFIEAEVLDYYGKDARAFILMKRKYQGYCVELTLGHESAKFAINETSKRANHPMNQEYQIKTIKRVGINYSKNRTVDILTAFSDKVELYIL